MPLSCSQPDCSYATEVVAENMADMLELLRLHTMVCHTPTTPVATPTGQTQAERVKRSILSLSGKTLDPEEYEHFVYTFRQFKARLGDDQDGATLLRSVNASEQTCQEFCTLNFGAALGSFTEEQILSNITRSKQSLNPHNEAVHKSVEY